MKEVLDMRDSDSLLLKCLQGSATREEYEQAWKWVEESSENKKHFEELRETWISSGLVKPVDVNLKEKSWSKIQTKINESKEEKLQGRLSIRLRKLMKYAAIILIVFMTGYFANEFVVKKMINDTDMSLTVFETTNDSKSFVTLDDGTKIWLNKGSKIQYNRNYSKSNRDIFLEGEAYFEVKKNESLPFLVHSGDIIITAIGTAFNVKSYPGDDIIETTLVEGSISVEMKEDEGNGDKIILEPNQRVTYTKSNDRLEVKSQEKEQITEKIAPRKPTLEVIQNINTELYTSWKDKLLVFEKESLEDISKSLENAFNTNVIIKDDRLKEYRLTGTIDKETLEEVLEAIRLTVPLNYEVTADNVILTLDERLEEKYKKLLKDK